MEKRVTLAIVLCLAVLFIWISVFGPPKPEKPPARQDPDRPSSESTSPSPEPAEPKPSPPKPEPAPPVVKPAQPRIPDQPPYQVDTDVYRCLVTNRGASILSLKLKKHFTRAALKPEERQDPENWLEVLGEYQDGERSLAVKLTNPAVDLAGLNWKCILDQSKDPDAPRIDFEYPLDGGLRIVKELHFRKDAYVVDMMLRLERSTDQFLDTIDLEVVGPAGMLKEATQFTKTIAAVDQGKLAAPITLTTADLAAKETPRISKGHDPIRYVAVIDRYFFSMLVLPKKEDQAGAVKRKGAYGLLLKDERKLEAAVAKKQVPTTEIPAAKAPAPFQLIEVGATYRVAFSKDSNRTELKFSLYTGPIRDVELEAAGLGDFKAVLHVTGYWFCGLDWIVVPVADLCKFFLKLFNGLVHNYGVAIVLLTLLVRLCMFPLTRKQMVSMHKFQQKMGKIKPEMDRLNQKYKNNPKKKQQEIMKLYKEHNMSPFPMMGCLPLFVNMPVFFGLFHALRSSMELRHAPFMLWIKDLSAPDALISFGHPVSLFGCGFVTIESLNVLPIIMGITWFAQMYFAPRPADPQQAQTQKMMMFMPLMFMFMLYNYAAGLSLYWTCNSLFGMIEQRFIKRGAAYRSVAATAGQAART
jgi:YidC/Oxa1 family membrane protein insertase